MRSWLAGTASAPRMGIARAVECRRSKRCRAGVRQQRTGSALSDRCRGTTFSALGQLRTARLAALRRSM